MPKASIRSLNLSADINSAESAPEIRSNALLAFSSSSARSDSSSFLSALEEAPSVNLAYQAIRFDLVIMPLFFGSTWSSCDCNSSP